MTRDEIILLKNAKNGDDFAINKILIDNKSLVSAIARKYFLLGGDSEDLIQEGMIGLFKAINNFDENRNDNFKNYAGKLIEREIISAIRRENTSKNQALNTSVFGVEGEILHDMSYPEKSIITQENLRELNEKIKKDLSNFEKMVFDLYFKGYSYKDIAKELNKSPKSIDNALARIKVKLSYLKENL